MYFAVDEALEPIAILAAAASSSATVRVAERDEA